MFRPVSLTSVAVKILGRMIANRLYHLAEENGWFSHLQAGFRQNRSCEDQIIRLTQAIGDGFQKKNMERSVLVQLDFSKAYDMMWQEKPPVGMAAKGRTNPVPALAPSLLDQQTGKYPVLRCNE